MMDAAVDLLAARVRLERTGRGWSLAELAERSGVSKAMLSKIERDEASPTAATLVRIATAFGLTLAALLTPPEAEQHRFLAGAEQPTWTDPATAYHRRQVFQRAGLPLELVEVELPGWACVALPASAYAFIRQVVWVLSGTLEIVEGTASHRLQRGDRLEFGPPTDTEFRNPSAQACRYLVAVLRQ